MPRESFPPGVAEQLKYYVYRLIDPRNGETFYVGKGQGDRVFAHARGEFIDTSKANVEEREDAADLKTQRIRDIRVAGLEVGHVVHRHGIEREDVAFEVEAALIDAYPGLTNQVGGHGARDYGCRHVEEIITQYAAVPFEVKEPLMLMYIGSHFADKADVYQAVRFAWKVNVSKARQYKLVLANLGGLVVGAYRPKEWRRADDVIFSGIEGYSIRSDRWGFVGEEAEPEVQALYARKRVPDQYRGGQNPVRYCHPDDA